MGPRARARGIRQGTGRASRSASMGPRARARGIKDHGCVRLIRFNGAASARSRNFNEHAAFNMISIIPRNDTCGCQPVSRRSLPLSPTSTTGFFFKMPAFDCGALAPVHAGDLAGDLQEFQDRVRFAGGHDKILRRRVAQNARHGLGIIAGITPIHDGVQIAQHQFFGLVFLKRQHAAHDFLREKFQPGADGIRGYKECPRRRIRRVPSGNGGSNGCPSSS